MRRKWTAAQKKAASDAAKARSQPIKPPEPVKPPENKDYEIAEQLEVEALELPEVEGERAPVEEIPSTAPARIYVIEFGTTWTNTRLSENVFGTQKGAIDYLLTEWPDAKYMGKDSDPSTKGKFFSEKDKACIEVSEIEVRS